MCLTQWGRVTYICVSKLTIIGSDNGLAPGRRQAIIWTNAEILSIGPLRTNFSEILNEFQTFYLKKMHLKMSSAKSRPFCLGHNVFKQHIIYITPHTSYTWFALCCHKVWLDFIKILKIDFRGLELYKEIEGIDWEESYLPRVFEHSFFSHSKYI